MYLHIKSNNDFQKVYKNGKSLANRYLVMYIMKNNLLENRIGISVSKKVGNSVIRHRITRLIRESYRLNCNMFDCGYDIVIIARGPSKDQKSTQMERSLLGLAAKFHILKAENGMGE